jgi:hypothetical protein
LVGAACEDARFGAIVAGMRATRLGSGVVLAVLTLFSPARSRAACARDADCSSPLICVRGECVRSVDPGLTGKSAGLRASDRKRAACLHTCDQASTKCQAGVRSVNACIRRLRKSCSDKCARSGSQASSCSKQCRLAETSEAWSENCSKQGETSRQACVSEHERCIASCGTSG